MSPRVLLCAALLLLLGPDARAQATRVRPASPNPDGLQRTATRDTAAVARLMERILARTVSATGPGCAAGVSLDDLLVTRSSGQADLERNVPFSPLSISEAGSVSKQFTAAAVVLLSLDGALDLDADVRRWLPELPVYQAPITVRHLLTHTSGLRDWGAITGLEGWPRGSRAHTNAHVLQVASRQQSLNYVPGLTYSYTNTGYNLLAILVERVSGQTLAAFTRERLFVPLGMTLTSWRDDHRRIVPGRALAYSGGTTPALDMPDESAVGNGGLLTTAEDLLRWAHGVNTQTLGRRFAEAMPQRMVLTGGDTIDYAMGVNVLRHRGTTEYSHSGSTGGYRAHLLQFPEADVGVAVLCNGASLGATQVAELLADSVVSRRARRVRRVDPTVRPVAVARAGPAVARASYAQLVGWYGSTEVGGEPHEVRVDGDSLVLRQAPTSGVVMVADSGSVFRAAGLQLWFERAADGRAVALHIAQDRAWDVRLPRLSDSGR